VDFDGGASLVVKFSSEFGLIGGVLKVEPVAGRLLFGAWYGWFLCRPLSSFFGRLVEWVALFLDSGLGIGAFPLQNGSSESALWFLVGCCFSGGAFWSGKHRNLSLRLELLDISQLKAIQITLQSHE
jgi:hypothetical protein